ncbi:MAG: acetyl-CoA C-acyltransferase [Schleiferiaceae bacterium]|nr:acetyl-CoA C-acyltransferase [Schleiferiaceae bacterium]MDR9442916.1 acetyl-CoA C-acyltransferase [Schleiferiaceae bacterium]
MDSYIVKAKRTAVGKAPKGSLRFLRPDTMAARVIQNLVADIPGLDKDRIDDVIVGNAMPEAEQGMNVGRIISLMGLETVKVSGMTVNRWCASGLEAIALATAKVEAGMADCIVAGGVESMSYVPMGGYKVVPNYELAQQHADYYNNMGLTAEAVAQEYEVSREDQDQFGYHSHMKALKAIKEGRFKDEIVPLDIEEVFLDENEKRQTRSYTFATDEGPRAGTTVERMSKLKPVFAAQGSVTAGNASQTSDGAAFTIVMSERLMKELKLEPIARLLNYQTAGVEPRIMGIGPVEAVPKVLKATGLRKEDLDLVELNEAFASQSLAVIRQLELDPEKVNVNGGAIAMGHPLGCTGAKLSVQIFHELQKRQQKYGLVTMCVGEGQGGAGIFEMM